MQEVSRPGVIDEFKGFDKSRIDEYNKAIEQQMIEHKERLAEEERQKMEEDAKVLEVNRQLAI